MNIHEATYINQLKREIKELKEQFEQYRKESIKWSVEDFTEYKTDGEYSITKEQAQEALEDMISHHDASLGITWETIECYLEQYGTLNPKYNEKAN